MKMRTSDKVFYDYLRKEKQPKIEFNFLVLKIGKNS